MIDVAKPQPMRGWYYGWNIVAVCILSQVAANGLTYNAYSLFLKVWSDEMNSPVSDFHFSIATMVWVASAASPFVGSFADKYPPRKLFAAGLAGIALFYVAISFTTHSWQIVALYGLLAPIPLCLSTSVVTNTVISRWFVRRLGLALGLSAFGVGMAGVVLPPLISKLLPIVGWRIIWRGGALIVGALVVPLVFAIIRNRPTEREGLHYLTTDGSAKTRHSPSSKGAAQPSWIEILSRKNFWIIVAAYLPMIGIYGAVSQNLGPFVANQGLNPQLAGGLVAVFSFAHLVATLGTGLISDRFGNRLAFAGLAVFSAGGAVVLAFSTGLTSVTVGCILVGLAGGLHPLIAAAMAAEFDASAFGKAFGMSMLFLPLSTPSAFLVARLQEKSGSYAPGLLILAGIVIVGGALSLFLKERRVNTLVAV